MSNVNQQINIFKQEGKKFTLRYSGRQLWYSSEKSTFEIIRHSRENLSSKYTRTGIPQMEQEMLVICTSQVEEFSNQIKFLYQKIAVHISGKKINKL